MDNLVCVHEDAGSVAFSYLLLLSCQGHAPARTHHIRRLCKRLALSVLVRRELSRFLNPQTVHLPEVCFATFSKERFLHFWRGKATRFRSLQTRAPQFSVENCELSH